MKRHKCPCQEFSPEIDEDAAFILNSIPIEHPMCEPWIDEKGNFTEFFFAALIDILEFSPPINKYIH